MSDEIEATEEFEDKMKGNEEFLAELETPCPLNVGFPLNHCKSFICGIYYPNRDFPVGCEQQCTKKLDRREDQFLCIICRNNGTEDCREEWKDLRFRNYDPQIDERGKAQGRPIASKVEKKANAKIKELQNLVEELDAKISLESKASFRKKLQNMKHEAEKKIVTIQEIMGEKANDRPKAKPKTKSKPVVDSTSQDVEDDDPFQMSNSSKVMTVLAQHWKIVVGVAIYAVIAIVILL